MKSLESIVISKSDSYTTLLALLPDRIQQWRMETLEKTGIDGFFFKDLRDSLLRDGHAFTSTNLKSAVRTLGFCQASVVIPNTGGRRVTVFRQAPSLVGRPQ